MATLVADERGSLCPECLRALVQEEETGQRVCTNGDYHEGADLREPLVSYADQEATVAEDERVRVARVQLGDIKAGSETPAQTMARVKAYASGWLAEWRGTPAAAAAVPTEQYAHPRREVAEQQSRGAATLTLSGQPAHGRTSIPPEQALATEAAAAEAAAREAKPAAPPGPAAPAGEAPDREAARAKAPPETRARDKD